MSLYYDKINMYFRLKDQKSHYKRIAEAKKNIDFKQIEHTAISCVKPNHKRQILKNREIQCNNEKLFRKLKEIKTKQGLLQANENESKNKEYRVQKFASINHSFHEEVTRENVKLVERLSEVRPIVGTRKQWEKQFKRTRSIEKKMHKYVKNQSIDPDQLIRETLTSMTKRKTNSRKIHTSLTCNHPGYSQNSQQLCHSPTTKNDEKPKKRKTRRRRRLLYIQQENTGNGSKIPINKIILNMNLSNDETHQTTANLKEDRSSKEN